MKASRPTPISCHTGPTHCSTCSIENVSCPAGTGVWVVNVLAARTLRTASAHGVPRVTTHTPVPAGHDTFSIENVSCPAGTGVWVVTRGTPCAEAVRNVRAASTFTTHTP